jgi:hypothetical protein
MKKFLAFFSTLFILQLTIAQTNVYHPFPENNAFWNEHMNYYCFSGESENDFYSFSFTGDTIFNSLVYHKVSVQQVIHIPPSDTCMMIFVQTGLRECIRQDSVAKKVYVADLVDTLHAEYILYDFNRQIGDSIGTSIVSSIDSILIGANYRKRWNIGGCICPYSIIEGIGSTNGIFEIHCNWCAPHSPGYTLNCFIENGIVLYTDGTTACNLIDPVRNISKEMVRLNFSPNPFHSTAVLDFSDAGFKNCTLKICNTIGVLVREEKISDINSYVLHRDRLNNGLYFYELRTSDAGLIGRGKFIVE